MSSSWFQSFDKFLFQKSQNEDLIAFPNLPLTGSLASILLVNLSYIMFVFKIGPWLMKNREPFNLKKIVMAYNAFQVALCSVLLVSSIYYHFLTGLYDVGCVLKLPPNHPGKSGEVIIVYVAYLSKYLDFCDTIFMVLRKSYRQITFLHVYHHSFMTFAIYCYFRDYGFAGHSMTMGIINLFVHVVMYSYYFLSASSPEMKKSIWWKRHLTELQLVQFVLALTYQLWPILVRRDCTFPKHWLVASILQAIVFIVLFGKFYKKTYLSKGISLNERANTKLVKKVM